MFNWMWARFTEKVSVLTLLIVFLLITSVSVLYLLNKENQKLKEISSSDGIQIAQKPLETSKAKEEIFLETIPDVEKASKAIEALNMIAEQNGFDLQEVRYKDEIRSGETVLRYFLDFEIQGDYAQIKRFMTELLVEQPYLSLQKLLMHRENIDENTINAQFKMMLVFNYE